MGSGQSVQLQGATEELLGRTGRFSLRADQKMVQERMAQVLSLILQSNNLFDLEALLKDSIKCDQLMLVVGSLIKKEFRTIRLPDPMSRGEALPVSFMTKTQYKLAESDTTRKAICESIAWFIVRFCTVITALIGSVRINDRMTTYIGTSSAEISTDITMNKSYQDFIPTDTLKTVLKFRQRPLSSDILNDLITNKALQRVTLERNPKQYDVRPIFTLRDEESKTRSFVMDTKRRIVYKSLIVDKTPIFGIEIIEAAPVILPGEEPRLGQAPSGARQVAQYPQPGYVVSEKTSYYTVPPTGTRPVNPMMGPQYTVNPMMGPQYTVNPQMGPQYTVNPQMGPQYTVNPTVGPQYVVGPTVGPQPTNPPRYASSTRSSRSNQSRRANEYMSDFNARSVTTRASTYPYAGGRRTRKNRNRKIQHGGGGGLKWYQVILTDLEKCESEECTALGIYYMDSSGRTITTDEYRTLLGKGRLAPNLKTLTYRIKAIQNKYDKTQSYPLKPPSETSSIAKKSDSYLPISKPEIGSYEKLKSLEEDLSRTSKGVSPAQYRAYILATSIDSVTATADGKSRGLHTLFCKDSWKGKVTEIPAYALLQALYSDRPDGIRETLTQDTLKRDVNSFIGEKLFNLQEPVKPVETFENVVFPTIPAELDAAFCKQINPATQTDSGDRVTRQETDVTILMNAHKELRRLYDDQLQGVFNILVSLLNAKGTEYGAPPKLILHEDFSKDPRGALVVLEERIAKARTMLVNHFQAVERVYRGALLALRQRIQGVYNSGRKL